MTTRGTHTHTLVYTVDRFVTGYPSSRCLLSKELCADKAPVFAPEQKSDVSWVYISHVPLGVSCQALFAFETDLNPSLPKGC